MIKYLQVTIIILMMLQAEEVNLNLPEKFDVKLSKHWWTENGNKPTEEDAIREFNRPYIFHFNKNNFIFSDKKHMYSGGEWGSHYQATEGKGTVNNNILKGNLITTGFTYTQNNLLHFLWTSKEKISGKVETNGTTHLIGNNITVIKCKMRENKGEGWSNLNTCDSATYTSLKRFLSNVRAHYFLHLPINQSQSQQKFIADTKQEPTNEQPQPHTLPKTNLSANIGASAKAIEEEPKIIEAYDQCKDPNRDKAVEEYCKNKAYNKKMDEEEEARKKVEYEAKEKVEKEYQDKLAKYNEEERQINLKVIRENEKNRERMKKVEAQENQAFHDNITRDMQDRKAKQSEIKKAHDIVDRFGDGDPESRRLSHKKIEELSKNADIEKATKIKNAMRKQYYDSRQTKLQGEAEYQTAKAKEIDKKGKYVRTIKDTSLTINKVIAKFDPTGTGDKIVSAMENTYTAIEGHEKGGWSGAVDSLVEKKASDMSGGWSDTLKEDIETYKKYQKGKSITLRKSDYYYDKKGNRFNKVKKGQKLYDKDHNEITFSFTKRIFKNGMKKLNDDHNAINTAATKVKEFKEGVATGDFNKAINAGLEMRDPTDSINGGTDKVVNKLEGL